MLLGKIPNRALAVGTLAVRVSPNLHRKPSYPAKKNVLSFRIGPPTVPRTDCVSMEQSTDDRKKFLASKSLFRKNSKAEPCNSFGARFGDDVDHATAAAAELRACVGRQYLEFLNRFDAHRLTGGATNGLLINTVNRGSIHHEVVVVHARAVEHPSLNRRPR